MKVRDIMTSEGLATATLDTTLAEIAERMRDENVGAIPIVDEDEKLAGIITDRDIVVRAIAEGEDPNECTAEEILSEQLHTIDPDADLEDAADLMARHQIRRLPVVEDETVIGMISLGDLAVKSEEDDAADVLEDVSEGVRQVGGSQPGRRQAAGRGESQAQSRGTSQRTGSVDSQFNAAGGQSSGEQVAEEEAEYQRRSGGRHAGGTRAESANAGRVRNQSQSQQSIANDIVDAEGEEEPDFQNAGGGQARQRANQQQQSARGREGASVRGRQGGELRESGTSTRSQGISNRSQKEESQRQEKVAPMRAESRTGGRSSKGKRKAS
jgi:CBS domain-containing protein